MSDSFAFRKNLLLYTIGSLVYYVGQWLTTVLIVRLSGYEMAGLLSLAMSVVAAPAIVSLFNVRSYQVSDISGQYLNRTYLRSRLYTNILSYLSCLVMVFAGGYEGQKAFVILLYMCYKLSEGYADVYYGIEQRYERLDYAGNSMMIRGVGAVVLFVAGYLLSDSLSVCIVLMTVFSFLVVFFYDRRKTSCWLQQEWGVEIPKNAVKSLLVTCIPLAVVAFLNNLSINLPKMALERVFGSEVMGLYSSVASPTVVVQLAATTIFAPFVPRLAVCFQNGDKTGFWGIVRRFLLMFGLLSGVCLAGAALLGEWGLVLLYGEEIAKSAYLLVPIVGISILIAINASLFSVCTLLREIRMQYLIGIAGLLVSILPGEFLVRFYSMPGVVYALLGTLLAQILIQLLIILRRLNKSWNSSGGKVEL